MLCYEREVDAHDHDLFFYYSFSSWVANWIEHAKKERKKDIEKDEEREREREGNIVWVNKFASNTKQ